MVIAMDVYKYVCDADRFDAVAPPEEAYEEFNSFDGRPRAQKWKPIKVAWYEVGESGDFPPLMGHVPVFSERASKELLPLVREHVEHLPLQHDSRSHPPIAAIHVLPILDCLDPTLAEIEWFESGIIGIDHYVFIEDRIAGFPMFRIKGYEFAHVFVTQPFREAVEAAKLRGLVFKKLP